MGASCASSSKLEQGGSLLETRRLALQWMALFALANLVKGLLFRHLEDSFSLPRANLNLSATVSVPSSASAEFDPRKGPKP